MVHKDSWQHASNYVAKQYIDPTIPRERYFEDAKLQMDAKLWVTCNFSGFWILNYITYLIYLTQG
jgi:hypothetical protein